MDREKEREGELETAMYTNCFLLGLDPSIISSPRVGLFRHSNPKLGEQLLYFILSSLRGPAQSAKDFDQKWPIFDSTQQREFRKVVQGIIQELEAQGALPRSNSRVSSLATCCGSRFVELLWQLSLHTLREVHRRAFAADVTSNPLPASLTDVAFSHAAALLPVTKARIAIERRRFLKNADIAVRRQSTWSGLAHEMTAEFRGLCAEEAYLQQELAKLQDSRQKAKLDGEPICSSLGQNSNLVTKANRLWESLLARKGQHEVLASGPIEDLIAHREHRYRISGSSLLAAMDHSSQVPNSDMFLSANADTALAHIDEGESSDGSLISDRSGRSQPTVDIAEILRRWTHALQRVHKQSLHLAKANDGEGPELLQDSHEGGTSGHAESLAATLAEHKQHLASIQVLINQLKEVAPAIQKSISGLTEEVNSLASALPLETRSRASSTSHIPGQTSGSTMENSVDEVSEMSSKFSSVHLEKVSVSPPAMKLPHLFSSTPNSSSKQKRQTSVFPLNQVDNVSEGKSSEPPPPNFDVNNPLQGVSTSYVRDLRRSVRKAAFSVQPCNMENSQDNHSYDGSSHFIKPLSGIGLSCVPQNLATPTTQRSTFDMVEAEDQVFSPPLMMEMSLLEDSYEDLLEPLSELDNALMKF